MNHLPIALSIFLSAFLAACATPAPEAAPQAAAAPAQQAATCPAKTEVLYRPESPAEGFVPAAPPGATVVKPIRLQGGRPDYPAAAMRCVEKGSVTIHFCIGAEGRMENIQIAVSSGFARLDNAVLAWAARERYAPGSVNGRARLFCGLTSTLEFDAPTRSETTPAL